MAASETNAAPTAVAQPLAEGVLCPDCGYDLRGSISARCPECGFDLDAIRTQEARIPWSRRGQIGWRRAYWQTVWVVLRWPKRFCVEMARPVSYHDAQVFRWVTALHAGLMLLAAVGMVVVTARWRGWDIKEEVSWVLGGGTSALLLLLVLGPGLTSYFFKSKRMSVEHQNRAIALSYYAWAPLGCLVLVLPFFGATLAAITEPVWSYTQVIFAIVTVCLTLYTILLVQRRVLRIAQYALHRSWVATVMRMLLLNVMMIGLGLLLALVPLAVFFGFVVYHSFH